MFACAIVRRNCSASILPWPGSESFVSGIVEVPVRVRSVQLPLLFQKVLFEESGKRKLAVHRAG